MKKEKLAVAMLSLSITLVFVLTACQPDLVPVPTTDHAVPPAAPTERVTLVTTATPGSPPEAEQTTAPSQSVPVLRSLFPPGPNDAALGQSKFFVDSVQLLADPDQPGATALILKGSLPTPCNQLRVQLSSPDTENRIRVSVYSVIEKGKICTQVLEPFEDKAAVVSGLPAGTYPVLVNGQRIGEIQVP